MDRVKLAGYFLAVMAVVTVFLLVLALFVWPALSPQKTMLNSYNFGL